VKSTKTPLRKPQAPSAPAKPVAARPGAVVRSAIGKGGAKPAAAAAPAKGAKTPAGAPAKGAPLSAGAGRSGGKPIAAKSEAPTKTAKPAAAALPGAAVAVAEAPGRGSKKPKPPAKTMVAPPPMTEVLLKRELPDVRRIAQSTVTSDAARGIALPNQAPRPKEHPSHTGDDPPVDAKLIAASLANDSRPQIEDNYDYTVLDDFGSSAHCPAPTRMVNTGCGGGEAAVYFARKGFSVVGIDSDRTAVGLARERAWLATAEIDFMVGDLFETPNLLPAESFGLAVDRGAFYRLADDRDRQRYLANVRRLLFKGGVFFLSAGFFPLPNSDGKRQRKPPVTKILLVREGGVVVNEIRQAGFDLVHRVLRTTSDSGDFGELLLTLRK
jgi:SAM-dependent methyltransferase